MKMSPDVR